MSPFVKYHTTRLRQILIGRGMSFQELAERCGLSVRTVYNAANGNNSCSRTRAKISGVLGIDPWAAGRPQAIPVSASAARGPARRKSRTIKNAAADEPLQAAVGTAQGCQPVGEEEFFARGMRPWVHTRDAGLTCSIRATDRGPVVRVQEQIGGTAEYRPDELRTIAAKLVAVANDADRHAETAARCFRRY